MRIGKTLAGDAARDRERSIGEEGRPASAPDAVGVGRRVLRAVGLWAAAALVFLILLHQDVTLMRWRYALLPEGPKGFFKQVLGGFREFGQFMVPAVAMIIVAVTDRRRKRIILTVVLAEVLAGVGYHSGKLLMARYRPYAAIEELAAPDAADARATLANLTGEQIWLGWRPGNWSERQQSFPSGHSAGAFALAAPLAWAYPSLAWLFWGLASGCALSRYFDAVHWLSDCWAGAVVGYTAAWLASVITRPVRHRVPAPARPSGVSPAP